MEVAGGSSANGANVQQNACTVSAQQQWRFQAP
jgi:Ricin-type beta-trefoil lectin domain-like